MIPHAIRMNSEVDNHWRASQLDQRSPHHAVRAR